MQPPDYAILAILLFVLGAALGAMVAAFYIIGKAAQAFLGVMDKGAKK